MGHEKAPLKQPWSAEFFAILIHFVTGSTENFC